MYKQIIIVRKDLEMSSGKLSAKSATDLWLFSVGLLEITLI